MSIAKTMECCNICRISNRSPLVVCAVCKFPFHMKCVSPKLTIKDFDTVLSTPGFYFYCNDHCNLSVHKLLRTLAGIEEKFRRCFTEINNELNDFQSALKKGDFSRVDTPAAKLSVPTTSWSASKRKSSDDISSDVTKRSKESFSSIDQPVSSVQSIFNSPMLSHPTNAHPHPNVSPIASCASSSTTTELVTANAEDAQPTFAAIVSSSLTSTINSVQDTFNLREPVCNIPSIADIASTSSISTCRVTTRTPISSQPVNYQVNKPITKHLKLAQRPKSMFLTGLDIGTSVDDIKEFASQFFDENVVNGLRVYKINSKSNTYVSFKLFCDPELFDDFIKIWKQEGIVARNFVDDYVNRNSTSKVLPKT